MVTDTQSASSALDERKIGRALALGIPLVTFVIAATLSVLLGLAMGLLVLVAGGLLGVIALLWGSLRVLSGDAPLSPELEALDHAAQGGDALASRKQMLLRALKDLENEKAVGKIDEEDFVEVAKTYRADLKEVLRRIDESLEPHRAKAEAVAKEHLHRAGLVDAGYRGLPPPGADWSPPVGDESSKDVDAEDRRVCPKCKASNEPDAKFCKECATSLVKKTIDKEAADEA
jgi:hypothetical protein